MKKISIILLFFCFSSTILSQNFKLGGEINFLTSNKYLEFSIGPSVVGEYSFNHLPISVRGYLQFYYGEVSKEAGLSAGYTHTVFSPGVNINYYPINWAIQPYIGFGVFYNSNSINQSGNRQPSQDGTYSTLAVEDNFSFEVSAGIKYSANSPINFLVEVSQSFSNTAEVNTYNIYREIISRNNIKFYNSLYVKLGLLFQL